jgi:L-asparaginase II
MKAYKKMKTLPFISDEPLRVLVNRNGVSESIHEVDIAVCDAYGEVHFGMGSRSSKIFPRSAMKPLQAIALIEMLNQTFLLQ